MRVLPVFIALAFAHSISAQHTNVMISNSFNPEEPTIIISTRNPKYIVAGANIRSVYYSADTGRTWTAQTMASPYGVWGDPVVICDTAGAFHYFHLTTYLERIVVHKSTDNGISWNPGTGIGYHPSKHNDKEWAVVDNRNNNIYTTWTVFDQYRGDNLADSSHIYFSRSVDGGINWSAAQRINARGGDCADSDYTVEGAVPAVGPAGQIYVSWAGPLGLMFDRSLDGGNTWLPLDQFITSIPGGWDYDIPGILRANGLPVTVCDVSNGPHRGTIYVNWSDQRNGENDTDVWLVKSTDGGNTWSAPIRVNDDAPGKQQFFTWMAVDQSSGYLYFVFYDRRNYNDNRTDVYMARSTDGGSTFKNFRISATPFVPSSLIFFGDYTNVAVQNGIVRPIWTRLDNGQLSVWTALVDTAAISGVVTAVADPDIDEKIGVYPNPFTNHSFISFKLKRAGTVSVEIYDLTGRMITRPIQKKTYPPGKYIEKMDSRVLHLVPGTYFYRITVNRQLYTQKVIRID